MRPLMPATDSIRPRRLVTTRQEAGTVAPYDVAASRHALQEFRAPLRSENPPGATPSGD